MSTLVVKLNATGDVVRTTTVLHKLAEDVTWITARANVELLDHAPRLIRCLGWDQRSLAMDSPYDLVINLEDERETAEFVDQLRYRRRFGSYLAADGTLSYTDDSRGWFDLSLISRFGRTRADELKLLNRTTYQELLFGGLGWRFEGEPYLLAAPTVADLRGDVAIAPVAGPVWPNKGWSYYNELKERLESDGLCVNVLPRRPTMREHMHDVASHRCLVSGDSLPMHLALATGTRCVTLFNCTSPWEIHGYGLQTQVVSPLLEKFFYRRDASDEAKTAIRLEDVYRAVKEQLQLATLAL